MDCDFFEGNSTQDLPPVGWLRWRHHWFLLMLADMQGLQQHTVGLCPIRGAKKGVGHAKDPSYDTLSTPWPALHSCVIHLVMNGPATRQAGRNSRWGASKVQSTLLEVLRTSSARWLLLSGAVCMGWMRIRMSGAALARCCAMPFQRGGDCEHK